MIREAESPAGGHVDLPVGPALRQRKQGASHTRDSKLTTLKLSSLPCCCFIFLTTSAVAEPDIPSVYSGALQMPGLPSNLRLPSVQ